MAYIYNVSRVYKISSILYEIIFKFSVGVKLHSLLIIVYSTLLLTFATELILLIYSILTKMFKLL